MQSKGYSNADMQQVWIESNEYLMSHNVRSAASSVQCEECHAKKQSGAFSSLISPDSILGTSSVKTVATLADKRLVDEGYIVLGLDYFKVDEQGVVTENVDDILYSTKVNPFMSILKASSATVTNAQFKQTSLSDALAKISVSSAAIQDSLRSAFGSDNVFLFATYQGDAALKASAVLASSYASAELLFPTYRIEAQVYKDVGAEIKAVLSGVLSGASVASSIHWFKVMDKNNQTVNSFTEQVSVKIPYSGTASNTDNVAVLYSTDGTIVEQLDAANILEVQPQSELSDGYILFNVDSLGYFIAMDR